MRQQEGSGSHRRNNHHKYTAREPTRKPQQILQPQNNFNRVQRSSSSKALTESSKAAAALREDLAIVEDASIARLDALKLEKSLTKGQQMRSSELDEERKKCLEERESLAKRKEDLNAQWNALMLKKRANSDWRSSIENEYAYERF